MTRMRILYVNHTGKMSGAERSLLDLLDGAEVRAGAVALASPCGPLTIAAAARGLSPVTLPELTGGLAVHPLHTVRQLLTITRAAWLVRRAAEHEAADAVHANSIRGALIACLARRMGGPPVIAHIRDCLPFTRVANLTRSVVLSTAAAVIANSAYTRDNFIRRPYRGIATVVHNGVDSMAFCPDAGLRERMRGSLGIAPDDFAIAVVGMLTPPKRQDTAIRVAQRLRASGVAVRLLIVGEAKFTSDASRHNNASWESELRRLAASDPRTPIDFLGDRTDMPSVYRALDAVLVPSTEEAFGRTIVEAMASTVVPIATAAGGPPEIISNGEDGFLVEPADLTSWVARLQQLHDDPRLREGMGASGRAKVVERFSWEAHRAAVLKVYALVAHAAQSPGHGP
jgi:glycosyltransferase involved in cell wall biosynthesis